MTDTETLEMMEAMQKPVTGQDVQLHNGFEAAVAYNKAEAQRVTKALLVFFEKKRNES